MRAFLSASVSTSALLAAVIATTLTAAPAAAADRAAVIRSLERLYPQLGGSRSVSIVDATTGETIFSRRPGVALVPASNEKLLVTAAALLRFGPDHRFETTVHSGPDASFDAATGIVSGDIYLVGGGDPLLGDTGLDRLATQLRRIGVRQINGGVVGDESAFDRLRGGPDSGYRRDRYLGGALSALAWHQGASIAGNPALTTTRRFAQALKRRAISYTREPRTGKLPPVAAAVQVPAAEQAAESTAPLSPEAAPPDNTAVAPPTSTPESPAFPASQLARTGSPPLRKLAAAINVPSQNFYAEMLLKALGAHFGGVGTTLAGARVTTQALGDLGVSARVVDGSGLTRRNRISSAALVRLLVAVGSSPVAAEFRSSLPVAGLTGTLRRRMRGSAAAGRCRAKTGTLRSISSLAGYCTTTGGREIAFALIENRVCNTCAKAVEDRIVTTIATLE